MKKYEYHDVNFRGTIKRIDYRTINKDGEVRDKYANVYLPYGYDDNPEKRYNILYVMHGGGGNADAWLDCCKVKNMLDYVINEKEVEPLIVVFPSFYKEQIPRVGAPVADVEREHVKFFQKELVEELLPAVESSVRTYAENTSKEALKDSRRHRGFGGFSMGGATTWFALTHNIDYFTYYLPLSGDCWEVQSRGGAECPEETAKLLHDSVLASGYGVEDYVIYTATGTEDPAYTALTPQVEAMKEYSDTFVMSDDFSRGNLHYLVAEGEVHAYEAVYHYLYNFLPYLFA